MTNTDEIRVSIGFQGTDHEIHQKVSEKELAELELAMVNGKPIYLDDEVTTDKRLINMGLAKVMKVSRH